jgi:sec-independent protein translocase protein TatA
MISAQTAVVLLAVVAVIFGARKLPEIGKGVGEAIRNFKKGMADDEPPAAPAEREGPPEAIRKKEEKTG